MFGLDITFPAFMSIVALIFLIAISCVNEKINVGFLGIGLGLLVGGLFADIPGNKAFGMFATSTFNVVGQRNIYVRYGANQWHAAKVDRQIITFMWR